MKFKETSDAKKGGLFVGKSHDEGGIPAIVTDTGTPIEVEGGEAIINKEATAKHWKELSKINQSAGNGVPIPPPHGVSESISDKLKNGGKLTGKDRKEIYTKWKGLVNMTASELEKYYNSEDGKTSGLTESEAQKQGIDSGRESARWIIKMKRTKLAEWTPEMWRWANKQISFISRMKGVQGELFDNKGRKTRKHKALLIWGHNPKKYKGSGVFDGGGMTDKEFFETEQKPWKQEKDDFKKGGKTIAQTPAPKKDRIYGSEKNEPESSSSVKSASKIEFDDKTLAIIENKVEEHNEEHPDKKITFSSAKAVVRRGMGAYSSSHRPTISGGKPNSRTAWGIARLNAFIYKIIHGKSKSGKYSQDDDLINELGYSVSKYENGGDIDISMTFIPNTWNDGEFKQLEVKDYFENWDEHKVNQFDANKDIRFTNGGNVEKGETFYTRTWNDGRFEKFSVDEYEKNIYPKLETGGLTQDPKMDRIKSLLYRAFPEIVSLDLLGAGLTGYAFLTTIGNDFFVVKYFKSVTEYWLSQMAMVSNPPNVVKFLDVKQLSDNFEYALIHEYVDTDSLPNKYVWNYTLGFFPKENFPYLQNIPEKEKVYVSNLAKTKAREIEDYFGVTIDTNHSNWGYNEDRELVLFDLDGNIKKQQFLDWMDSHKQKLETGGEIYDYHSDKYAEGGTTESKEIFFDNGRLQIRNVGGSNVYYKKVNNQWDFLNETELKKLKEGSKHELEHSKTIKSAIQPDYNINDIASAIAWDHLTEDMDYYDKLSKIESPTKYENGGNIELKNNTMKIVTKWNEVPSNWRNVKGIKPLNFSYSPYDNKLQSIVKDFVSKDSIRPALSGMFFDESGLTVTDAHKVLHLHFDNKEYSGIYPTAFTQKQLGYKGMSQEELAKRVALEKFPAYKNVIPKSFTFVNEFDVLKLRQYVSSALNYANPITHQCIFKVNEERFGLNIEFLESTLEAFLKVKQVEKLYFYYNNPNNGVLISDVKNFDIDKDTYCLIMPVFIDKIGVSYGCSNDVTKIDYNVYFDFTDGEIHNADGTIAKIENTYEDDSMLPLSLVTLLDKYIKISSAKKSVPILYNFLVEPKYIIASDLDSTLKIKNEFNMASGLYEVKNNAVQFNLSDNVDLFNVKDTFTKSEDDAMMSARAFIFYVEKAAESVGDDDLRPIQGGILLDFKENGTFMVSTNGHVLSRLNISDSIKIYNKDLIGKQFVLGSIKQLSNFLSFIDCDSVQLAFDKKESSNYQQENQYRLTCGNKTFTANLVDGKFPNYDAVIPYFTDKMVSFDAKKIYECINNEVAKSFLKENTVKPHEVYFYNKDNELFISYSYSNKSTNNESVKVCNIDYEFKEAQSTIDINTSLILMMPIMSEATHFAFKSEIFNTVMAVISKDYTTLLYKELSSAYVFTSKNLYYNEETFNTVIPKTKKESKPKELKKPSIAPKGKVLKVKGRKPIFKIGDMVIVTYGEEAGKRGKITQVFSYEKYPESMKPDDVPYYEITNMGKEIPESNLAPFSESKEFPDARDKKEFIDYVNSFYGKGDSIYGKDFPNKGFTIAEIKKAVDKYLSREDLDWGNGDSVDREQVRDILLATLPETKPTEKKESVSKQDYQDAIDGVELLLSTGFLNKDKKQELEDYLEGLKVMLMSMK
jgi:DNA polymerase III sliding clamp (beta) subunit (PCNA family)